MRDSIVGLMVIATSIFIIVTSCQNEKEITKIGGKIDSFNSATSNLISRVNYQTVEINNLNATICKAIGMDYKNSQTDYAGNIEIK